MPYDGGDSVQHLAPKTQPDAKDSLREEWISNILRSGAWRAKWRSMPLLWMLVIGAFVFPMGLWSSLDVAGQADEITPGTNDVVSGQTEITVSADDPLSALPEAPTAKGTAAHQKAAVTTPVNSDRLAVTVVVSGQVRKGWVPTSVETVKDVVQAMNLNINPYDKVQPVSSAHAYNGIKIRITRVRNIVKTRVISIPSEVRYQVTTALRPGSTKKIQSGRSGRIEVSQRIWFKDGVPTKREDLGRKQVSEPQDTILAVGANYAYMPGRIPYHNRYASAYGLASRYGSPRDRMESYQTKTLRRMRSITLVATGYSPDPRENGGWSSTTTGLPIGYGAAAVDPSVVPLGTKLYVEGYGYAFACDTGSAIRGHRIDLAYNSYSEANSKGHRKVRAWILAP